jgi:hypothetical protein
MSDSKSDMELASLLLDPKARGDMFLRNVGLPLVTQEIELAIIIAVGT